MKKGGTHVKKYLIIRTNLSADCNKKMVIGQRLSAGEKAVPFTSLSSAENTLKRQRKQDEELCPECLIGYEIVTA